MHLKSHKLAIPDLLAVMHEDGYYYNELYMALAMCFVYTGDSNTAIRHIGKGLSKFPRFVEGYVLRGQLYNL